MPDLASRATRLRLPQARREGELTDSEYDAEGILRLLHGVVHVALVFTAC